MKRFLKGITLKKNLIAVRSADIKAMPEGCTFIVGIGKDTYDCVVAFKKEHVEHGFRFFVTKLKCLSHPEVAVTEYTSI